MHRVEKETRFQPSPERILAFRYLYLQQDGFWWLLLERKLQLVVVANS